MSTAERLPEAKRLPSPLDIRHCIETEPPELDFVLPGFLAGTVGGLVAAGGVGKSMFSLEAAISIAADVAGANLLDLSIEKHGRVVIFAGEDPDVALHHRIKQVASRLAPAAREKLQESLAIYPCVGDGVDLMDDRWFEPLRRACKGARLVVIDTLTRFHSLNENDAADAKAVMAALERLAKVTGAAILYLHHVNKGAALNGIADLQQAARGSSVFVDNARWLAFVAAMSPEEARAQRLDDEDRRRYLRWGVTKQNYGAPVAQKWYQRGEGGVLLAWEGNGAAPRPPANERLTKRGAGRGGLPGSPAPWE